MDEAREDQRRVHGGDERVRPAIRKQLRLAGLFSTIQQCPGRLCPRHHVARISRPILRGSAALERDDRLPARSPTEEDRAMIDTMWPECR